MAVDKPVRSRKTRRRSRLTACNIGSSRPKIGQWILGTRNNATHIAAIIDSAEPTIATSKNGFPTLQPEQGLNGHGGEEQRKYNDKPIDQHGVYGSRDTVRIVAQKPYPKRVAAQPSGQERIHERHDVEDLHDSPYRHRQSQRSQDRMPSDGCNRSLDDHNAEADGQPALACSSMRGREPNKSYSWSTNHTPPAEIVSFAAKANDLFDPGSPMQRQARRQSSAG